VESEEIFIDKVGNFDLPHEFVMGMVAVAYTKPMEGHFAKLYSNIDNLKTEVSMLKTTVASHVEENKQLVEVRRNAPDPEKQPLAIPMTPKKDLMIRPQLPPAPRKRVGTPLAREVLKRNLAKQVEKDNATPMIIDESDVEPGRSGKAPRLISPPPSLMHSQYAGDLATTTRGEDNGGDVKARTPKRANV